MTGFENKSIASKEKLTAIREAVQQHTGGTGSMSLDAIADAIRDELAPVPTGTMNISSPGNYDVTDCAMVTVEDTGGGGGGTTLNWQWDESTLTLIIEETEEAGE